jgi:dihydropyrimidinase
MKIIIKNATIVNFDSIKKADVLIKDKIIEKIDTEIIEKNAKIIDAKDKYLFPGGIDPHVHMHLPTSSGFSTDNFDTGTRAALMGGTTMIIDFVTPHRGQSLVDAFLKRKQEAQNAHINVKFHVTPVEWRDSTADEMTELVEKYGVSSFKIYTAYKNSIGINDDAIIKVMQKAKELGALVTAHCENNEIIDYLREKYISEGKTDVRYHALSRPAEAEAEAIHRMIIFSKFVDTPIYIVHVSTRRGIEYISNAQNKGVKVFAETCPHYLLLDDSVYEQDFYKAAKFVLSPPIRKKFDQNALWQAIVNGNIQTIGTDHCPFNLKGHKDKGLNDFRLIANGAGSVEHRLKLLLTYGVYIDKISLQKFAEITAKNPAQIFKIKNKGQITEGYDADMYIYNPMGKNFISSQNHYQNCDSDIYEGVETIGKIETVIIGGKIINTNN